MCQPIENLTTLKMLSAPVKFLVVIFRRVYLSCPLFAFNDVVIKILVKMCFIQYQRKIENRTIIGFCSIVFHTPASFFVGGYPVFFFDLFRW